MLQKPHSFARSLTLRQANFGDLSPCHQILRKPGSTLYFNFSYYFIIFICTSTFVAQVFLSTFHAAWAASTDAYKTVIVPCLAYYPRYHPRSVFGFLGLYFQLTTNHPKTTMSPETDKAKRTRTNVSQSKFGCFTCKYDHPELIFTCMTDLARPELDE